MNPSASPQGRGDRVFMLFIIGMTHTAPTEPLEGEGYKFKQEDSGGDAGTGPHAQPRQARFSPISVVVLRGKRAPKVKRPELNRDF